VHFVGTHYTDITRCAVNKTLNLTLGSFKIYICFITSVFPPVDH